MTRAFTPKPGTALDVSAMLAFDRKRTRLIDAFRLYDEKAQGRVAALAPAHRGPEVVASVRALVQEQERLTAELLELDSALGAWLEAQTQVLGAEAARHVRTSRLMGKFRSSWMSDSGEGIDQKL